MQYDDNLNIVEEMIISSNKLESQFCRVGKTKYRTIENHSRHFIFLEICAGPFKDDNTI